VRLKGGDPFIFGRGGEEIEALARSGIECEVVNGITSGLAAATAAGVPLTHRSHAQGVIFVTAHAAPGRGPDWHALAASRMTIVVYMGVARAQAVQHDLIGAGLPRSTPVLVVENATLVRERQIRTTLERLTDALTAHDIASPAVMVIGEVARAYSAGEPLANIPMNEPMPVPAFSTAPIPLHS
jgi:uroporphyrin-III C-methyltransferase